MSSFYSSKSLRKVFRLLEKLLSILRQASNPKTSTTTTTATKIKNARKISKSKSDTNLNYLCFYKCSSFCFCGNCSSRYCCSCSNSYSKCDSSLSYYELLKSINKELKNQSKKKKASKEPNFRLSLSISDRVIANFCILIFVSTLFYLFRFRP
jgi:hypothetical protein